VRGKDGAVVRKAFLVAAGLAALFGTGMAADAIWHRMKNAPFGNGCPVCEPFEVPSCR
jgi:hypothetical protein